MPEPTVELPEIVVPLEFNYIAAFLTFSCQLRCVYCINHHGGDLVKGRWMSGEDWITGLNRIKTRSDLPITVQGGEPTVHKHFYQIVNGIKDSTPIDLLTNLEVSAETFMANVRPDRLRRVAPYASIRVSYHHGQSQYTKLMSRVKLLADNGYHIGVWEVAHPDYIGDCKKRQEAAQSVGIDYRLKEFLGPWKGHNYGTFKYDSAVNDPVLRSCDCRTSELIIGPDGSIFRCHSDLYADRSSIGHILDPDFTGDRLGQWQHCAVYGKCNSCDIKVKNNRFQEWNHSSVEIRNISTQTRANKEHVNEVVNTYGKA